MKPEQAETFKKYTIAGITIFLLVLAFSPFLGTGETRVQGYNKVIIERTISKDFYSSQGRSFVDAERLENFLKSPKEGASSDWASEPVENKSNLDSFGTEK